LKIIIRILFIGIILSLPLHSFAKSGMQFPYHINKTVKKEMTYDYAFETIWETALALTKEIEETRLSDLRKQGIESVKTSIKSDKSSGLITLMLTHEGKEGFLIEEKPLFHSLVVLLEPLGDKKTRVNFHEINFFSYNRYVFHGEQLARYVDFTPSERNILEEINVSLKGKYRGEK